MSTNLEQVIELSEKVALQAAEVACMMDFLHEASLDMDFEDRPSYINARTIGTIQAAVRKMADQLAEQNEGLTRRLQRLEVIAGGEK